MLGVILAAVVTASAAPSPSPAPSPSAVPSASPLPFTPPAGWTQLPPAATRTQVKNAWTGPKTAGKVGQAFSQVLLPMPLPLDTKHGKRIMVCGIPAQLSSVTAGTKSERATTETEVVARGGFTYLTVYVRPAQAKPDPRIQALLQNFCPPQNGEIAKLTPPAGWTASPDFKLDGMWMGPAPMQMMMLATGPEMKSLRDVVKSAPNPAKQSAKFAKGKLNVSTRPGTLCGLPSLFVTVRSSSPDFPFGLDSVATQNANASYMLVYMHPAAQTPLPAAMNAMQTLCATFAPQPASPAPSPSSTP